MHLAALALGPVACRISGGPPAKQTGMNMQTVWG